MTQPCTARSFPSIPDFQEHHRTQSTSTMDLRFVFEKMILHFVLWTWFDGTCIGDSPSPAAATMMDLIFQVIAPDADPISACHAIRTTSSHYQWQSASSAATYSLPSRIQEPISLRAAILPLHLQQVGGMPYRQLTISDHIIYAGYVWIIREQHHHSDYHVRYERHRL